jgi:hypothetical protein
MILQLADGMGDSQDAISDQPGVRPDMRMVGDSVVLVIPVLGARIAEADVHLILRIDSAGEMFAALDGYRIECSRL